MVALRKRTNLSTVLATQAAEVEVLEAVEAEAAEAAAEEVAADGAKAARVAVPVAAVAVNPARQVRIAERLECSRTTVAMAGKHGTPAIWTKPA